jgi:2-C-methyl-D-erythritol 4-phosphate cytidylyltransferase
MAKVSVIVPAAGASTRYGGRQKKILERLGPGGPPVFLRTLEAFTSRDDVCQTQLVVAPEDLEEIRARFGGNLGFMGVQIIAGGACRSESVRNALANVLPEVELVCVHDAVRPCIAQAWIDAVFARAAETGAALLAVPVHGTMKAARRDGRGAATVERTLPRGDVWEAQTPQVFRRDWLLEAYASGKEATDDAALVEAVGHSVHLVHGDPRNIKITTPADLTFAAAVFASLPKPKEKRSLHPFAEDQNG